MPRCCDGEKGGVTFQGIVAIKLKDKEVHAKYFMISRNIKPPSHNLLGHRFSPTR